MTTDDNKRRDPGDAVREGVRSVIGILGALKDAIEETFEELRTGGEATPEDAREAAQSTFRAAKDAVEDVRERLDFVTRREFEALEQRVAELSARVDALGNAEADTSASEHAAEEGDAADPDADEGRDFRYEFE
jgi:polyhydroxyalkanoate synthesis regulator phasin